MEVTVIDNRDFRLNLAKKLGADHIINSTKVDAFKTAMEITGARVLMSSLRQRLISTPLLKSI